VNSAGTTNFTLDGQNVAIETTSAGILQARYTQYPETYGGLASQNQSGTSSFHGFDSQMSNRILVSISGIVTDAYSFKALGEELESGSGTVNPHRYGGEVGYYRDMIDIMQIGQQKLLAAIGRSANRSTGAIGQSLYFFGGSLTLATPAGHKYCTGCKPTDPACTLSQKDITDNICPDKKVQAAIAQARLNSLAADCICEVSFTGNVQVTVNAGCFESDGYWCHKAGVMPVCNIVTPITGQCSNVKAKASKPCNSMTTCKPTCGKQLGSSNVPPGTLPMPSQLPIIKHYPCDLKLTKLSGIIRLTGTYTSQQCCADKT
jgi:hypothetical protein